MSKDLGFSDQPRPASAPTRRELKLPNSSTPACNAARQANFQVLHGFYSLRNGTPDSLQDYGFRPRLLNPRPNSPTFETYLCSPYIPQGQGKIRCWMAWTLQDKTTDQNCVPPGRIILQVLNLEDKTQKANLKLEITEPYSPEPYSPSPQTRKP